MADDDDLTYFLHIPKTGGTTLHRFLMEGGGGPERVTQQLLWDDMLRGSSPITPDTAVIVGHFAGLLPVWLNRWPRMLTIIREPIARSMSHINHVRRDPGHPRHARAVGLDVVEYCADPVLRLTISDFQARYLASLSFARVLLRPSASEPPPNGMSVAFETALFSLDAAVGLESAALSMLDQLDGVGVTHDLDRSIALFAAVLGWPAPGAVEPLNVAEPDQQGVADLTQDELVALRALTVADRAVYDRARARLDELCALFGIDVA